MNLFFRIISAIYAVITAAVGAVLVILPFADKTILKNFLDWTEVTLYRSDRYNILVFVLGIVILLLNLVVLFFCLKFKSVSRYICFKNDGGQVRVSSNSVENIALGLAKKSRSVREAKSKVRFRNNSVDILMRLTVYPDTHVPNLSKLLQSQIKQSVESMTELTVGNIDINIEGVHAAPDEKE